MLKQIEPKSVTIEDVDFAIYPFGAMQAANLSGELGKFFGPMVAGLVPLILGDSDEDVLSADLKDAMPLITMAFSTLDGDNVEKLLRKLLIVGKNISCQYRDDNGGVVQSILDQELIDNIFCQNIDGLYRLAYEVINVNFSGFFKKSLAQSGIQNLKGTILSKMGNTEPLMEAGSANLS